MDIAGLSTLAVALVALYGVFRRAAADDARREIDRVHDKAKAAALKEILGLCRASEEGQTATLVALRSLAESVDRLERRELEAAGSGARRE